jgi:hypothetical protein
VFLGQLVCEGKPSCLSYFLLSIDALASRNSVSLPSGRQIVCQQFAFFASEITSFGIPRLYTVLVRRMLTSAHIATGLHHPESILYPIDLRRGMMLSG